MKNDSELLSGLVCEFSEETSFKLRSIIFKYRNSPTFEEGTQAILEKEEEIITEFIKEEFGSEVMEFFNSRISWNRSENIKNWDFPGRWLAEENERTIELLSDRHISFIFSNSGLYSIKVSKLENQK